MSNLAPETVIDEPGARRRDRRTMRTPRSRGLSRVVWRWHFYAGVLTSPILIIVALTGLIFIYSPEIEQLIRRERLFVRPTSSPLATSALIETAQDAHPGWKVSRVAMEPDVERSVVVSLADDEATASRDIYINPYNSEVLADVDPANDRVRNFFTVVLEIHRSLFIGTTGRVLVELATCWGILLMMTGIYLWWPRRWNISYGVWLPRLRARPYTIWRDLHTVVGIYALPVLLIISLTGMFYTVVWGQGAVAASVVAREGVSGLSEAMAGGAPAGEETLASPIEKHLIDKAVRLVRREYSGRSIGLDLATASDSRLTIHALGDYAINSRGPYEYTQLTVNPRAGNIVKSEPLAEDSAFWWHRWTYPLHVGSFWGQGTKFLWAIGCLVLTGLPITGLWMWWIRRPKGCSGIPKRPPVRLPMWLLSLVAGACVLFPVAGASVLAFVSAEWAWDRYRKIKT